MNNRKANVTRFTAYKILKRALKHVNDKKFVGRIHSGMNFEIEINLKIFFFQKDFNENGNGATQTAPSRKKIKGNE